MTRLLVDENLSENLADGLNLLQKPMKLGIEVVSIVQVYGRGVKDEDWIPDWGGKDGIFLTCDINIIKTKELHHLFQANQMGAFFLKPPRNAKYWQMVEMIINNWTEISDILVRVKRPYSYRITPRKFEKLQ